MSSVIIAGDTSGTVTLAAPAVAGTTTLTLPSTSGTVVTTTSGAITSSQVPTGSVVQVVSANTTTRTSTTSTSYVDVSLSASITPLSASNNILVIVTYTLGNDNTSYASWSQLLRGSTQIAQRTYYAGGVGNAYAAVSANLSVLDSPATTSSTTYKMQIKSDNASGTTAFNGPATMSYSGGTPTNYATITLIEVKG
jgi:hypothetical protein